MIPDEREWQAQERAMQVERNGQDVADVDNLAASYVSIAKALRQPLVSGLPSDFANRTAARVAEQLRTMPVDSGLERWLLNALAVVMALSGLLVLLLYRDNWLAPLTVMLGQVGSLDSPGLLVMALCLAVSWLAEQLRRQVQSPHRHPA